VPVTRDDYRAKISRNEIDYLCEAAKPLLQEAHHSRHGVWSYSACARSTTTGAKNPSAVTRDYHLLLDTGAEAERARGPSVFGGKITTYRKLAEQAMEKLSGRFSRQARLDAHRAPPRRESRRT